MFAKSTAQSEGLERWRYALEKRRTKVNINKTEYIYMNKLITQNFELCFSKF